MRLTIYAKKKVAHAMFRKGTHFLAAAVLLHQKDGYRDVVLHLLCQGLEIVQKGLLLASDYDKFRPKLKTPLGHDLVRGSDALHAAYALKPLKKRTRAELQLLSNYYCKNVLRYGTNHDLLVGTEHLQFEAVMRKSAALTVFGNKIFR